MELLTTALSILGSASGGGIIGGAIGLFKMNSERKERIALARIDLTRDKLEYDNASAERSYKLQAMSKQGEINLKQTEAETAAEIETAHVESLGKAQAVFSNLKTSKAMDNFRASVRPTLAYLFTVLFTVLLIWLFAKFSGQIDSDQGMYLLMQMINTLIFTVTSLVTFYYVARPNKR